MTPWMHRVFIVAAGTWQELHRPRTSLGFGGFQPKGQLNAMSLHEAGQIPEEILRRFNSEILHIDYPSVAELREILAEERLCEMGHSLGREVNAESLRDEMNLTGMSVLTSLKTELLLLQRQKGLGD